MKKVIWVIAGGLAVVTVVMAVLSAKSESVQNQVMEANLENGEIADHVLGNINAPVKIYEYIDYQCEHCASLNRKLQELVAEYDGQVAVVARAYVRVGSKNGEAAARAAEAAGLQGFFEEYRDILFLSQSEWMNSDPATRQQQFERYFEQIRKNQGDLVQFRVDMNSEKVAKKLEFDEKLAKTAKISYVPLLFVNDTEVKIDEMGADLLINLRKKIDFLLNL